MNLNTLKAFRQQAWEATDEAGRRTQISRFDELYFQQARDLLVSVIRVERPGIVAPSATLASVGS